MHDSSDYLKTDSSNADDDLMPYFKPPELPVSKDLQNLYRVKEKVVRSSKIQAELPLVVKNEDIRIEFKSRRIT